MWKPLTRRSRATAAARPRSSTSARSRASRPTRPAESSQHGPSGQVRGRERPTGNGCEPRSRRSGKHCSRPARASFDRGVCLAGPHRDELELSVRGLPGRGYASHGESWSLALALRLASFDLLRTGREDPALTLDDVFAELDTGPQGPPCRPRGGSRAGPSHRCRPCRYPQPPHRRPLQGLRLHPHRGTLRGKRGE